MSNPPSMHPELGREVPIGSIDRELRKLWEEDEASTNASLINLAVYSEEPDSLVRNSAAVRELTREHACRAILIGIDRGAEQTSIKAWITAHCHLSHGMKSVCCEQIAFALTGKATGRLRNTVFAHLSSDLPLILWWQGELSPIFGERFYSLVDRFVFDSSEWRKPLESFERILEACDDSARLVVQDISWTRCYQFRVSVAALFDDPVAADSVDAIHSIRLVYHPKHRLTALQLVAWMAVQAGWREGLELSLADSRRNGNGEGFSFESKSGNPVEVTMVADRESAPLGYLGISAGDLKVEVAREASCKYLLRRLERGGHWSESPGPVDPDSSVDLIGEQLSRGGKNSLYRKVLPCFLKLLSI